MKLEIGQPAPDFLMYDTDKNPFRLSEHKGTPFLLLFFHSRLPLHARRNYAIPEMIYHFTIT